MTSCRLEPRPFICRRSPRTTRTRPAHSRLLTQNACAEFWNVRASGVFQIVAHDEHVGSGDIEAMLVVCSRVGALGQILRENPELRAATLPVVRSALAAHDGPDGVRLNAATWVVTARAPPKFRREKPAKFSALPCLARKLQRAIGECSRVVGGPAVCHIVKCFAAATLRGNGNMYCCSLTAWKALPAEYKKILEDVKPEAYRLQREAYDEADKKAVPLFEKRRLEVQGDAGDA